MRLTPPRLRLTQHTPQQLFYCCSRMQRRHAHQYIRKRTVPSLSQRPLGNNVFHRTGFISYSVPVVLVDLFESLFFASGNNDFLWRNAVIIDKFLPYTIKIQRLDTLSPGLGLYQNTTGRR
jgi:hypothetical protein